MGKDDLLKMIEEIFANDSAFAFIRGALTNKEQADFVGGTGWQKNCYQGKGWLTGKTFWRSYFKGSSSRNKQGFRSYC